MQTFHFIHARFPDPAFSKDRIVDRLRAHRRSILAVKMNSVRALGADDTPDEDDWRVSEENIHLTSGDRSKIDRRAETISQRQAAATGLSHLRKDDIQKLEVLRQGVRLSQVTSEHHADELAAKLHAEFPWMAPATETVWHAMRRSVRSRRTLLATGRRRKPRIFQPRIDRKDRVGGVSTEEPQDVTLA
jgi:hypothetical protein